MQILDSKGLVSWLATNMNNSINLESTNHKYAHALLYLNLVYNREK